MNIKGFSLDELYDIMIKYGFDKYRGLQIYNWINSGVGSFDEMVNIPTLIREKLKQDYTISFLDILEKHISEDGTVKYLFSLRDGNTIETVVMNYKHGISVCVSTQVGCKMGCAFCASTIGGKKRNLFAFEILDQIIAVNKDMGVRTSNVVLMGTGEPLDNFDNVVKFLRLVNATEGLNISLRRISVSTCGLIDEIKKLSEENLPITLSISLHAPNDTIRNLIMPINKKYGVNKLILACKEYIKKTKRRISFEYTLIDNVNDSDECAIELSKLLRGMLCHVNLIPVNETLNGNFKPSRRVESFQNSLLKHNINATVRRKLGDDISAACGQLRSSYKDQV